MSDPVYPLFVYGTLRPGASAFGQVAPFIRSLQTAVLSDAQLYDLGPYPMVVPGAGQVVGELLDLEPKVYVYAINSLDRYEGYNPQTDSGLFLRRETEVTLETGEIVIAWVYVGTPTQVEAARQVPSGDWLTR